VVFVPDILIVPVGREMMDDLLPLIVRIVNANAKIALGRDSSMILDLRDLLVEKGMVEMVDLYDCKVCDD
jgi:hypothetical protein